MTDLLFALALGVYFGFVGAMIERPGSGVAVGALLAALYGAYVVALPRREGVLSGVTVGCVLGTAVSLLSLWAAGTADTVFSGALFGLVRGGIIGAAVGAMTHALPDPTDPWHVRAFLIVGSIVVGAVLGVGVGIVAGAVLGGIGHSSWGLIWAALLGIIVGGYLASYYKQRRLIWVGAIIGAALSLAGTWIGGAFMGMVLGLMSGAFAPMLLVASIGAYGGLASRGVRAMVVEAAEAPSEMMRQGAVPFLAPSMIVGLIVGTAVVGRPMLLALPAALALLGLTLGVLGEVEGKVENRITARLIVEMIILGTDDWPIGRILHRITAREQLFTTLMGLIIVGVAGGLGAAAGAWIGQQVTFF